MIVSEMKPYNNIESKSEQVTEMFDTIAPHYDKLNHFLSLGIDRWWRRRVVRMVKRDFAQPKVSPASHATLYEQKYQRGIKILDLATGTADLAISIAKGVDHAEVVGADPSGEMLGLAKVKVEKRNLSDKISLQQCVAENLPFEDSSFDAVTVAFGVRNFEDLEQGVDEMCRVLKREGRIYILEFSMPEGRLFGAIYRLYFHKVLPILGGVVSKDRSAYEYLPDSVDDFPAPGAFRDILGKRGFVRCRSVSMTGGVAYIYSAQKL